MNTIENKAKFFAQNIGEYVWDNRDGEYDITQMHYVISKVDIDGNVWVRHEKDNIDHKIELEHYSIVKKPLSSISDEDLEFLGHKRGLEGFLITNQSSFEADYLRSKGYALDWNGITVEQQIEYGWIKLK